MAPAINCKGNYTNKNGQNDAAVRVDRLTPGEQHAGKERQVRAALLVDAAEARHDIEKQKQRNRAADRHQEQRIDGGVDHALAHRFDLLGVADVAGQRGRKIARALGRAHRSDVEPGKRVRKLFERARERAAFAQHRGDALEQRTCLGAPLLLRERIDRLDERQPGADQHAQLLAEEHQRKTLGGAAPRRGERLGAHAEHGVAAPFELLDRGGAIRRLKGNPLDAAVGGDRLQLETHGC
jgi:hypothetical protein